MRIYVCVKHVPDTAANIKITGDLYEVVPALTKELENLG